MDAELERIKDEHVANLRKRHVIMIEQADYGYRVHQWSPDGVAPQSDYDTPHEAVARAMQLLKVTEPVKPQDWPEEVCVGFLETENGDDWVGCDHLDCLTECSHSLENPHCERFARWQRRNEP